MFFYLCDKQIDGKNVSFPVYQQRLLQEANNLNTDEKYKSKVIIIECLCFKKSIRCLKFTDNN